MEEILASIRRIIEDNDTGRKPEEADVGRATEEIAPPQTFVAHNDSPRGAHLVDAFRAELRKPPLDSGRLSLDASRQTPRADVPEVTPPTAPAEIKAEIGALSQRWMPDEAEVQPAVAYSDETGKTIDAVEEAAPAVEGPIETTEVAALPVEDPLTASLAESLSPEPSAVTTFPVINAIASPKSSILSERAERQVAASFGELSEAFAVRSKKTFDELAEEMMRPMLQDWLDNNLPVLVERLVREEIERVARGAQ